MIKRVTPVLIGLVAMALAAAVVGCNTGDPVKAPPADTSKSVPGGVAAPGTDQSKMPPVQPRGAKKSGGVAPPPA